MATNDPTAAPAPAGAMDIVRIVAWAFVVSFLLIVGAFVFVIVRDGNSPLVSQAMDALVKIGLGDGAVIVALIGGARFVDAMASRSLPS